MHRNTRTGAIARVRSDIHAGAGRVTIAVEPGKEHEFEWLAGLPRSRQL
jgi:hypothetical protein